MSKIGIVLIGLFVLINAALFFILYKDNLPRVPFSDNTATDTTSNSQTFKGLITQVIPTGSNNLQIVLDTTTPKIIVEKDFGVARFSPETGEVTGLLTAGDLKAGDTVEITIDYDLNNKNYDVSDIYLR